MICYAVARSESDTFRACILTWGILAFSAFPEQLFQWHDEENSSYTATALYGNLTRFHKQFAYLILNVELILFFVYFFKN